MENQARTTAYRAALEARRAALAQDLARIFQPPHTSCVLEVGSGHGHFLAAYASAHPETLCLGVDITSDRVARALRKRDRAALANLHFLHADARVLLETLPPAIRVAAVFILFPDPWPKLRHRKHRILQSSFLSALAAAAAPGCRLAFRTDFEPYFQEAHALFAAHPGWQLCDAPWPFDGETVFQRRASRHFSLLAERRANCPVH